MGGCDAERWRARALEKARLSIFEGVLVGSVNTRVDTMPKAALDKGRLIRASMV
jgi:hypothetical protein